ncbi:MAG TPA: hypothetical protein VMH82_08885 [Myxococcota bacterium]|nr:hypothetical protein [Myxococcota bacterium]
MKPETTRGLRRLLPRRKRTQRADQRSEAGISRASGPSEPSFDPTEFAEFLEADDAPIPVDPAFKERLRQRLWTMVREQIEPERPTPPPRRPTPRADS